MLTKKAQDMTAALQEAITKDPAKAADLTAKVQAVTAEYQGATTADEACKAYCRHQGLRIDLSFAKEAVAVAAAFL
ncbi:hypothetical protein ACWTU6_22045 [Mesorhizobium sp. BHbsci]